MRWEIVVELTPDIWKYQEGDENELIIDQRVMSIIGTMFCTTRVAGMNIY